jgi:hypothetical protein
MPGRPSWPGQRPVTPPPAWLGAVERVAGLVEPLIRYSPIILVFASLYLFLPTALTTSVLGFDNKAQPMWSIVGGLFLLSLSASGFRFVIWLVGVLRKPYARVMQARLIRSLSPDARLILGHVAHGSNETMCWWRSTASAQELVDRHLFYVLNQTKDTIAISASPEGLRLMDSHRMSLRRFANDERNDTALKRLLRESGGALKSRSDRI